jgi:hypothetical protein
MTLPLTGKVSAAHPTASGASKCHFGAKSIKLELSHP